MALWTCRDPACGSLNKSAATTCERCGTGRARSVSEAPNPDQCARCPAASKSVMAFHDDTLVVGDRGARLCASCWISALRRRADASASTCACGAAASDHVLEAKVLAGSVAWQSRFATRRAAAVMTSTPRDEDRASLITRRVKQLERFSEHLSHARSSQEPSRG